MAAAVYLFLNLGLFYFAFLINSGAMIVCGLVMAALFLFFFISGLVSARKTHILLSMKDGQLDMTIQKTGILPLTSLKFVFSFLYDQSPEGQGGKGRICFPKGESHAVYPLSIPYSGSGRITADRLKVSDLSGLFSFRVRDVSGVFVNVFPKSSGQTFPVSGERILSMDPDFFQSVDRIGNDSSETLQVHEYLPGDRLNRIHHKLSAKKGTVLVRDFAAESAECFVFVLDFKERSQESFHKIVNNLFLFGRALLYDREPFLVLWADENAVIYKEKALRPEDMDELLLYIYETMKSMKDTAYFTPIGPEFILNEAGMNGEGTVSEQAFVITDEEPEILLKRWQHES